MYTDFFLLFTRIHVANRSLFVQTVELQFFVVAGIIIQILHFLRGFFERLSEKKKKNTYKSIYNM